MDSSAQIVAGLSSAVLRLSAIIFLRWIPGHHFPPIIIASLLIYLTCIYAYPETFYLKKRTLDEAFPAISETDTSNGTVTVDKDDEATLIGQSDLPVDPIIGHEDRSFFKTVLLGIPDWNEIEFSYLTIGVNIVLALFALDLVFRGPVFYPSADIRLSRVGYVDSASAKVLVREPDSSQYPLYAYLKDHRSGRWSKEDTVFYSDEETDYTYPITFEPLSADTEYTYELSNNLTGTFRTAPQPSAPAESKLIFLTSSCIKANFPYSPFNHALYIPGFTHLSTVIQSLPSPATFMLFLGDFIYVDVPLRLSSTIDHYRAEYRRVYASPSWKLPGILSVPWFHTLDDHEIANDWSGGNQTEPFPSAADPFMHYHVAVNPPTPPKTNPENTTYFQFTRGPASFFMLDTRRYRTTSESERQFGLRAKPGHVSPHSWFDNSTDGDTERPASAPTMVGAAQLTSLLRFISTPEPSHVHWKFITSSVPFTKNWRFGTSDTWGGFLSERQVILDAMHAAEARLGVRVIVLSGDRHEFGAIRFPPPITVDSETITANNESSTQYDLTPQSGPHEFSVGPLSMFYLPVRTFRQVDEQDVSIKYLPDGNSKIGAIELQNLAGVGQQKSFMRYSLYVDGKVTWEYTLTSPAPTFEGHRQGAGGWRDWI